LYMSEQQTGGEGFAARIEKGSHKAAGERPW